MHWTWTTTPIMEDVQRSALRMKSRTYLMEKWSPQRYGDTRASRSTRPSLNANISADDLAKLSLPELKAMAARVFARNAERDDTIDVTPSTTTTGRGGGVSNERMYHWLRTTSVPEDYSDGCNAGGKRV